MPGQQANQYDKICRENLEAVIPSLIKDLLGIQVAYSEELPDDIQHTKERKPDALKKLPTAKAIRLYCTWSFRWLTSRIWCTGWLSIM